MIDASLGPFGIPNWHQESAFFFTNEVPAILDWPFDAGSAAHVEQPVLVVQGGVSPPQVHDVVAQLAEWLPDARVETIAGSDHMMPLRHPHLLAATIAEFVRPADGGSMIPR